MSSYKLSFASLAPLALALFGAGCVSPLDGSKVAVTVYANAAGARTAPVSLSLDHALGDGDTASLGTAETSNFPTLPSGSVPGTVDVKYYGARTVDYVIFEEGARLAWVRCWTVEETEVGPAFAKNYLGAKHEYRIEATPTFAACADVKN